MSASLTERYDDRLAGVLSCFERAVITGTIPTICYAEGMTRFLYANGVRIFDYPRFAQQLRDVVRKRAETLAWEARVPIEHIARSHIRKEDVVARELQRRGRHPGLVYVISAMEPCDSYRPWHDKASGRDYVRSDSGKCLHYFYFVDDAFGLISLRVPTWSPFRLQFYCNGHSWLARCLDAEGIGYTVADNAFVRIDDWPRAQQLADTLCADELHRVPDRYAALCCPVCEVFGQTYHWSLMQMEYATDLAFRSAAVLGPLYDQLISESVLNVKAEQVASFLGRRITPSLEQEVTSRFSTRIQGTCIKHRFGASSVKMYDKAGIVLRIETTTNDASFFKYHRKVEHRDGPPTFELAPVRKTIYSLSDLREILLGCNRRYLAHLSALDDFSAGVRTLERLTKPRRTANKTVKGLNFFAPRDKALLQALRNPRYMLAGLRRSDLQELLDPFSPHQLSRRAQPCQIVGPRYARPQAGCAWLRSRRFAADLTRLARDCRGNARSGRRNRCLIEPRNMCQQASHKQARLAYRVRCRILLIHPLGVS